MRLDPGAWSRLPMPAVDFWSWTALAALALVVGLVVYRVRPASLAWRFAAIAGGVGAVGLLVLVLGGNVAWSA